MDTIKIGKFIAESRKKKELTQAQLAERLGVTTKTISRWENGNYMPDISLLKPLSEELEISLNDLLSGERVEQENYQEKFEENILNTIDYTNKKTAENNNLFGWILLVFGVIVTMSAMTIFPSESSWGSVYSVIGIIITTLGVAKFIRKIKFTKRIIICAVFLISSLGFLIGIDYIGVVSMHQAPRFVTSVTTTWINDQKIIFYDGPFYDVIRRNADSEKESYQVVKNNSVHSIVHCSNDSIKNGDIGILAFEFSVDKEQADSYN